MANARLFAFLYLKNSDQVKYGGVLEIHCDNEFQAAMDLIATLQSPPILMNYLNPQEHVPETERNNRTIEERVRACSHYLPYVHLSIRLHQKKMNIQQQQHQGLCPKCKSRL